MSKHLQRDLEALKKAMLAVGGLVEEAIGRATTALVERRTDLTEAVRLGDDRIDEAEVAVEEECLKMLALHQPVAADLRFIITVLKVNNDLERMGDMALNTVERASYLAEQPAIPLPEGLTRMVAIVREMVRGSLDALVERDAARARAVWLRDDDVDALHRSMFQELYTLMHRDPGAIERAVNALGASRNLERIADLATNIAEDVIFMVEGEVIRHRIQKSAPVQRG